MMTVEGTRVERSKVVVHVTDKEIIETLKKKIGVKDCTINENGDELGFWIDESSERSNFEKWKWYCKTNDKKAIELFKAIKLVEEFLKENNKENNKEYNSEYY
ncbi:hypothetical protein [Clostridium sp. VAP52]|uniref:hypothetical protein n=1 Tax=Clostridium sp. VAP52 TaxID=2949977 RepID=UPI00207A4A9B|nr:hypothetical protein [Clostridium sp. VAP52]